MPFFSCPLLRFCFVFLPSLLICEGFPFFPPASVFAFVSEARRQTCCLLLLLFFFSFCQAGKGLGGTAVRNLQHSESGSCLWMSVSLSPLLDALEDILYECVLSAAGRQRCFIAVGFKETLKLFSPFIHLAISLTYLPEKHAVQNVFVWVVSFMQFSLDQLLGILEWLWICFCFIVELFAIADCQHF